MSNKNSLSPERIKYLKKVKRQKIATWTIRFLILVLFFALWEIAARLKLIDAFVTSQPSRMLRTLENLYREGDLFRHIGVTCLETVAICHRHHSGYGNCCHVVVVGFCSTRNGTLSRSAQQSAQGCFGSHIYHLDRSGSFCHHRHGPGHIANCYYTGSSECFYTYRRGENQAC